MFDALKLSIVVTAKVLADVLMDIAADIAVKAIASRLGYYFRGLDIN